MARGSQLYSGETYHVKLIEADKISPSSLLNLRADVADGNHFFELVSSIKRHGLIQPVVLRPVRHASVTVNSKFEIVCGHRRYAACRSLNKKQIPSIIMDLDDQQAIEIALVENLQRRSLDPIEEAEGFKLYISAFGRGSISRLAEKIGKSEEYVSHRLLLLGLPRAIIRRISRRLLKPSEATELIWLKDENLQLELADELTRNHLSFRQARVVVRLVKMEKIPMKEAVKRVTEARVVRVRHAKTEQSEVEPVPDWMRESDVEENTTKFDILDRAILTLRTCLSGLDLLVERNRFARLNELLMKQRQTVHESLDELVREKVRNKSENPNPMYLSTVGGPVHERARMNHRSHQTLIAR